jgi:hypothetical protein
MSREIDPHAAVDFIVTNAPKYAKAKAERVYLEQFRKTKKALLMKEHAALPLAAQEREAYAHPDYLELLDGLKAATEIEEALRWQMVAAEARIEVWRTQEASNRVMDRSTR